MNAYILAEGKRTEMKVYPAWFKILKPTFSKVTRVDAIATDNSYFMISGMGMPHLLTHTLPAAVSDVNKFKGYDHLVIIVDSEGFPVSRLEQAVLDVVDQIKLRAGVSLSIIVQNICIETWFLGNRSIVGAGHQCSVLNSYLVNYNVKNNDPERARYQIGNSIAKYHLDYLKRLLKEKNEHYSKVNIKSVIRKDYLEGIIKRRTSGDLISFQRFLDFINLI